MRRALAFALIWTLMLGSYVRAQIVPALPFQLQNNTTADATQVMANFNQLLNSINANSAKNGINSDITSLLGLTTPLAPSVGGTNTFTGGTSTGGNNAQLVTPVVPNTFALAVGVRVVFVAGFTNTAALQINVAGSGLKNVFRKTQNFGAVITAGYEVIAGDVVEVVYDGTQFQLAGPWVLVGDVRDFPSNGAGAPNGYLVADGSCVSQTTYAALFNMMTTAYGSCSAGNFALPDYRGRVTAGNDGGAGRLSAAGGCTGTTTSATCGTQTATLVLANLPAYTPAGSVSAPTITLSAASTGVVNSGTGGGANLTGGGGALLQATMTASSSAPAFTGSAQGGTSTPVLTLPPLMIVNKIIKY